LCDICVYTVVPIFFISACCFCERDALFVRTAKTKDNQTDKEQTNAQAPGINPDIDTKQAAAMIFETLDIISKYQEKQNKEKLGR
jgi:hypothetical protein